MTRSGIDGRSLMASPVNGITRLVGSYPGPPMMPEDRFMSAWPNRKLLDLLQLEIPIIQSPMAGSDSVALARGVCSAGALGSLACALLSADQIRDADRAIRQDMPGPFNLNFFCHTM